MMLFAALHESAAGPKQTWRRAPLMSASGGPGARRMSADDPERTWTGSKSRNAASL